MSNLSWPSNSRISKLMALLPLIARHSILNMRLGLVPLVDVYIPHEGQPALAVVSRSSQKAMMESSTVLVGKHTLVLEELLLVNCKLPLELTFAEVNGCP